MSVTQKTRRLCLRMFKKVDSAMDFPRMEEEILEVWREEKIFEKSVDRREKGPRFVFYEGPPQQQMVCPPSRTCSYARHERCRTSLQNHERLLRATQGRLGYSWFAC